MNTSRKFVPVGPGVRISFGVEGAVAEWRGATGMRALELADARLLTASGEEALFLRCWIDTYEKQAADTAFEATLERAASPRLQKARRALPEFAHEAAKEVIYRQERERLQWLRPEEK